MKGRQKVGVIKFAALFWDKPCKCSIHLDGVELFTSKDTAVKKISTYLPSLLNNCLETFVMSCYGRSLLDPTFVPWVQISKI